MGFTVPTADFAAANAADPGCSTLMAGCTGDIVELAHSLAGSVTVIDDCTFEVTGWEFDGLGPAVEWWVAAAEGDDEVFPYPANAKYVGALGPPGNESNYVTGEQHMWEAMSSNAPASGA